MQFLNQHTSKYQKRSKHFVCTRFPGSSRIGWQPDYKSQVGLLQTAHYWANAGVLLSARVRRRVAFGMKLGNPAKRGRRRDTQCAVSDQGCAGPVAYIIRGDSSPRTCNICHFKGCKRTGWGKKINLVGMKEGIGWQF